jgi:SAM-dependent methyltransferase
MPLSYDRNYLDCHREGSYRSAKIVLPIIFERFNPASVIDVGCGVGGWLKVAGDLGATQIVGVDGDYIDRSMLMIDQSAFVPHDLASSIYITQKFDLAISLEVAEHLGASVVPNYLASLMTLSDMVLFSAAIPAQGGTDHVNENWMEFWAIQFVQRGYLPLDIIRPRIWNDRDIEPWYRQNIMIFANRAAIARHSLQEAVVQPGQLMSIVHPEIYMRRIMRANPASLRPTCLAEYHELIDKVTSTMRAGANKKPCS